MKYLKTTIVFILIFGVLWYLIGSETALDYVQKPEIVIGLAILFIVILFNGKMADNLNNIRYDKLSDEEKEAYSASKNSWYHNLMQSMTKSKPIEEESDILMNHEYDGIRELDNDLPPWWLYGFYISIVFAVVYLGYYEFFGGDSQTVEFEKEMAQAKTEIEEYKKTAKDLIDASTVVLLTEDTDLAKGKTIFDTSCVVCHLADAGGSIGPNLTDEYWILGGGIKNVFTTVSEGGREGKGMIPWKSTLSPSEIQQVSSYILSLQGTTPAKPKPPEGDIWVEGAE